MCNAPLHIAVETAFQGSDVCAPLRAHVVRRTLPPSRAFADDGERASCTQNTYTIMNQNEITLTDGYCTRAGITNAMLKKLAAKFKHAGEHAPITSTGKKDDRKIGIRGLAHFCTSAKTSPITFLSVAAEHEYDVAVVNGLYAFLCESGARKGGQERTEEKLAFAKLGSMPVGKRAKARKAKAKVAKVAGTDANQSQVRRPRITVRSRRPRGVIARIRSMFR
jgi:hypothetical protein